MEAKKWIFAVTLTFIMALTIHAFALHSNGVHYEFYEKLKNTILGMLGGGWPSSNHEVTANNQGKRFGVSPNLTTCHESVLVDHRHVYCCPPKPESVEVVIDFQFPDPSFPLRVRRPVHLLDDEYMAKYKKAVYIMKSLPYDDPRSFKRQADVHCTFCTNAYNQEHSNAPFGIHRSWLFFPFHRMFLHFHERILGSLIGDDTFALPFWNWDNPDGMMISEMYMKEPFFDENRDPSHFPPCLVDIDFSFDRELRPEEQVDINMATLYKQIVSGAKKTELFMGCPYKAGEKGFCNGPGTLEAAIHNTIHKWVGSNLYPEREDMGIFYSAARDPIFYPHHTNIDRLWEVWRGLNGNQLDITDPDWLDSYFYFYDETTRLVRIKIRDVLNMTKLRYAHEEVDLPWLNWRPNPSVSPKIAHSTLIRENENRLELPSSYILSQDFGPFGRSLDTSITVKVYRPKKHRSKKEKEEEEEVMVVYGIDVKEENHIKFDVYVNVVNETMVSPASREYAGTFVYISSGVRLKKRCNLKLGITELLEDLEADGDESIWVRLLPRTKTCTNITIDGVRIEYMR